MLSVSIFLIGCFLAVRTDLLSPEYIEDVKDLCWSDIVDEELNLSLGTKGVGSFPLL